MSEPKIVDYERETVPARYELSLPSPEALVIKVRTPIVEELGGMNWGHWVVPRFEQQLGLKEFSPFSADDCGFGAAFRCQKADPDWISWRCEIPVIDTAADKALMNLRASLCAFTIGMHSIEHELAQGASQLIALGDIQVDFNLAGGSLSATLTPATIRWLSARPDHSELVSIRESMRDVYDRMLGKTEPTNWGFQAYCRQPKWINLSIPGNACGLDPSDYYNKSLDHGYRLAPHNVDSGLRQITLLAGLAKLHDLVRGK